MSLRRSLAAIAVAGLLVSIALFAWKGERITDRILGLRYGQVLPTPSYPAPQDAAEAYAQDLDYFARFTEVDRSFDAAARARFAASVAALRARAAALSQPEFVMGIARCLALADNPHTNLDGGYWRALLDSAPVRLEWFDDGLYVIRARTQFAHLLGARVLAVDGFDPATLVQEGARYFGGPPEHARVSSPLVLESPQALHVMHPEAPADRLVLTLADAQGRQTIELPAVDPNDAPGWVRPGRLLSPMSDAHERPGEWRSVLDGTDPLPPSLRDPNRVFYATLLGEGVLYMHVWQVRNGPALRLDMAIVKAVGSSRDPQWKRIVLDLRFNTGGEYPTLYRAIRELPERLAPDGKLMIVIDNTTFSAAIITAALAKHFTGARATIVGERPRDRLTFWAEGNTIQLPNSKIEIPLATGYHDWAHGCREWRCFWPNIYYGIGVGSVEPDVKVGWKFDDYKRGVDTVLEAALR
jgi:hypothetical protein